MNTSLTEKGNGKLPTTQKPEQNLASKSASPQPFSFHTQVAEGNRPLNSLTGFQGGTGSLGKGLTGQVGGTSPLGKGIGGQVSGTDLFSKDVAGTAPFLNKDGIGQSSLTGSLEKGRTSQSSLSGSLGKTGTSQSSLSSSLGKAGTSQSSLSTSLGKAGTSQSSLTSPLGKTGTSQSSLSTSLGKAGTSQSSLTSPLGKTGTSQSSLTDSLRKTGTSQSNLTSSLGKAGSVQSSPVSSLTKGVLAANPLSKENPGQLRGTNSTTPRQTSSSESILTRQASSNQSNSLGLQTTSQTHSSQSLSNYPGSFGQISSNEQKPFSTGYSISPIAEQSDHINYGEQSPSEPIETSKIIEDKPSEDFSESPGMSSSAIPVRRWFVTLMCMNIPIIGWIYLMILACSRSKGARRDFAKAYLLYKLLFLLISAVILAVAIHYGLELLDVLLSYMDML